MSALRILVVEDERAISAAVRDALAASGHAVDVADDGLEAIAWVESYPYDLLILDVVLPGLDGFGICARVRERGLTVPILMLTALDRLQDRVAGLDYGADDYLVKTFAMAELRARVRALARRQTEGRPPTLRVHDLELDPATHAVRRGAETIELSVREFAMLELFARHPGHVFHRDRLPRDQDAPSDPGCLPAATPVRGGRLARDADPARGDPCDGRGGTGERRDGRGDAIESGGDRRLDRADGAADERPPAPCPDGRPTPQATPRNVRPVRHRRRGPRRGCQASPANRAADVRFATDLLISGDAEELRRALANLIDNAYRYGGPAATVRVTTRASDGDAIVQVADDGPGIPPTDLPRIFDPFYRVRADAGGPAGSGLGLAIAKSIVERSGGSLSVVSRIGAGTTFVLSLRRSDAGAERPGR